MKRSFSFFIVLGLVNGLFPGSLASEDKSSPEKIYYDGFQLWKANVDNAKARKIIVDLKNEGHVSTWSGSRSHLDILVKPTVKDLVDARLRNQNISYEVLIEDLQKEIDAENPPIEEGNDDKKGYRLGWDGYYREKDIREYLEFLNQTYPDLCTLYQIGSTYEGRPLLLLRISNGNLNNKAVFIDGGIHAREWVSPAAVTYFINHLISDFENLPDYIQNTNFYIAPLVNPDGYEYSHSVNRMWRKNVSPIVNSTCIGVDLNRNFGYKWGLAGASKDPCDETYLGTRPFSELETEAVRQFILGTKVPWKAYMSFHSYGEYIIYPWGYANDKSSDYDDLTALAKKAANAIEVVGGPAYIIGASAETMYPAAGGSDDWAKGGALIKYSYTIELRDKGRFGFVLPARLIKEAVKDALTAIDVIVKEAVKE